MKLLVVAVCLFAVACAAPPTLDTVLRRAMPALRHEEVHDDFGQYALRYITAEGTVVSERGYLVPSPLGGAPVMVVDGETSYIGDDGKTYVTRYSAGPHGARFEGDHLPVAPKAE